MYAISQRDEYAQPHIERTSARRCAYNLYQAYNDATEVWFEDVETLGVD